MAALADKENSILFVDDEKRVLTSMRAMFRRDYNVFLANSGQEALDILRDQAVDVVVSDQRMPGMTGVAVLKEVKAMCPNTMRILLTGYADLQAIEESINDAEVFRYLMKPCPSVELKEAVALAANVASGGSPADDVAANSPIEAGDDGDELDLVSGAEIVDFLDSNRSQSSPTPRAAAPMQKAENLDPALVEVLVLSQDANLTAALTQALGEDRVIHHVTSVAEAIERLEAHPVGVLVTDTAVSEKEVTGLTTQLKTYVPELVTVIASDRSDAQALITMINYGQIFRFLLKPLQVGQCRLWLESAINKHIELARSPNLVRRHQVRKAAQDSKADQGLFGGMRDRMKRIRGRFFQTNQMA